MTESARTYSAYGLRISSAVPLPDLTEIASPVDAIIRLGKITGPLLDATFGNGRVFRNPRVTVRVSRQAMYFDWNRLGKVIVRNGNEVIIDPADGTTQADLGPFVTGPVLAVLLHQRGYFVLHASGAVVKGVPVVFLGAKGYGKSTLAAYLRKRGHSLLSDDIVPLYFKHDEVWTLPGFPRIKLYDDSISAIGSNPADFSAVHRFVEKRSFQFADQLQPEPVRLAAIYILDFDNEIRIDAVSKADSFIEILKNTHLNSFLEELNCQPEYFDYCRRLVRGVPVFRLARPHRFSEIAKLGSMIENHVSEIKRKKRLSKSV